MLDTELFKIVLNGGSFALMAIFVVWVLFRGEPRNRETIERIVSDHKEAIALLTASHQEVVNGITLECREERREDKLLLLKEGELNRESRHELSNKMQEIVASIYERDRNHKPRQS